MKTHEYVENYIKIYPNKILFYKYHDPYYKKIENEDTEKEDNSKEIRDPLLQQQLALMRSLRRSRTAIQDYVLCNDFDMFATFTFAHDRQNIALVKSKMYTWLQSQRKYNKDLAYILVPEFHKDNKSIHFHGLLKNLPHKYLYNTKIYKFGYLNYNIKNYSYGFSNLSFIKNKENTASYIRKYITKDMPKLSNKKRYWHSKNLKKPKTIFNIPEQLINNNLTELLVHDLYTIYKTTNTSLIMERLNDYSKQSIKKTS